jgi:hypothetical protein
MKGLPSFLDLLAQMGSAWSPEMTMKVNKKHSCGLMDAIIWQPKNNFMMAGK